MKHVNSHDPYHVSSHQVHGNARTALPFYRMKVGDVFVVDTEAEYTRACSARAHYVKMMRRKFNELITIVSSQIKDKNGNVTGYMFKRVNYVPPKTTQWDQIEKEDDQDGED